MRISDVNKTNWEQIAKATREKLIASQVKLNANVTVCDIDDQIEQIKQLDENLPLYGVCIAVKDNISTQGIRTTASSYILDNYVPVYDATIIQKLKAAGAIIVSKTSMDELGMGGTNLNAYTGKVNNPYNLEHITGGSSGGSAAVVAAGLVPIALGTDTGDSIRKPAHYCGLVGLKPTYGRISRYGVIPYASSLDHVGFFTTTVKDSAKMLEITAGRDNLDMTSLCTEVEAFSNAQSSVKGKKIAILKNVQDSIDDQIMLNKFTELCDFLRKEGAIVEEVLFNQNNMNALLPTYLIIANAEATANHANLDGIKFGMQESGDSLEEIMTNTRTKGFSTQVRTRFLMGEHSLDTENQERIFRKAQKVRRVIVDELNEKLAQYDALLSLAASSPAPTPASLKEQEQLSDKHLVAENNMLLGNFSGYPSISIPLGFKNELPFGISLLTKAQEEMMLFEVGLKIEEFSNLSGVTKGGNIE